MSAPGDDKNKDVWSEFHEVLAQYHLSTAVLDCLLHFVNIPPKLTSFEHLASNLVLILRRVADILEVEALEEGELRSAIPLWINYCETIVAHRTEIEVLVPGFCQSLTRSPYYGSYKKYPLGVALWFRSSNTDLCEQYVLLQAYLCLSYHLAQHHEASLGRKYKDAKEKACLATRNLSEPYLSDILRSLPTTALSLKEYSDTLSHWDYDLEICRLRVLFTHAMTGRKESTGSSTQRRRTLRVEEMPFENVSELFNYSEDDSDKNPARVSTMKTSSLTESQLALQEKNLCAREEFTSPRETIHVEHEGPDPSGGYSRSQYLLLARGQAAATAMRNQRLPNEWDRLTAYEVKQFLFLLSNLANKSFNKVGNVPAEELAAFLAILFWTSSSIETVLTCTLVPTDARSTVPLSIQRCKDGPWLWVIKPRVPRQSLVSDDILSNQALTPVPRYTLPIPPEAVTVMKRYLATFPDGSQVEKLFSPAQSTKEEAALIYNQAAAVFLGKVRFHSGGRHKVQRVSMHLHDLISRLPGADITTAMSISGRNDPLGSVPLHYTVTTVSHIDKCYKTACSQIRTDFEADSTLTGICDVGSDGEVHVGSRYVPRKESVQNLVKNLRKRITESTAEMRIIDLHNAITIYTVQMLGYATGYRNVRDPLLQEAEIDRETCFAVISDKDDDSYYNSRIVWLPDLCMRQLDSYREHLELFQQWLFEYDQKLFFKVREEAVTGRHADRTNPALLILWKDGRDNPLSPKVMKHLVGDVGFDLPGNANRHYLRTMLLARNCPLEVIDAFMGHWSRGVEPWGRYSGLSPITYRQELSHHLVKLLESAGWEVEYGLRRNS